MQMFTLNRKMVSLVMKSCKTVLLLQKNALQGFNYQRVIDTVKLLWTFLSHVYTAITYKVTYRQLLIKQEIWNALFPSCACCTCM